MVGDGWGHGEGAPRSLGIWWVGVGHRMFLQGLGAREKAPPVRSPDTHFSRCSQGQGSGGHRCSGDGTFVLREE